MSCKGISSSLFVSIFLLSFCSDSAVSFVSVIISNSERVLSLLGTKSSYLQDMEYSTELPCQEITRKFEFHAMRFATVPLMTMYF